MNRTFFHPFAGFVLATAVACTSATGSRIASTDWMPTDSATPTRQQCKGASSANQMTCYQKLLAGILKTKGMDSAMATLTSLAASEEYVRADSHMFAHTLGLTAYTTPDQLAAVFSRCSPGFQSGCYHGVIQGYFLEQHKKSPHSAVSAETINSLCKDFRDGSRRWLLFQCAHGLGHGLELTYAHVLPKSLTACDLVTDGWERTSCYGGAFMENIVSVTNPHQTAEGMTGMKMEGMEDMEGMDMSDMDHGDSAMSFKKYDSANPLYPCSALAEKYGSQCYLIQTSLILFENHGDFAAAAKTCGMAPENFRTECFMSLGRDANSYAGGKPGAAARSCDAAPEMMRPWCHVGVAKNVVDITANPSHGFKYCSALTENVSKVTCYFAIGEEINALSADPAKRSALCKEAPSPFDGACYYGARLTTERPAGLVRNP